MIREIIRPNSNNFTISIPNEYVNQEVEFIMFPLKKNKSVQETKYQDNKSQNITNSLFGALKNSDISQNNYNDYLENKYL
jgi:hypothetical protein